MVKGATDRVQDLGDRYLPGGLGTPRAKRLVELFHSEPEPGPVAIWRAWMNRPQLTDEERRALREAEAVDGFDPAGEQPPNTADKALAVNAYKDAVDAGLEDAAGLLRTLNGREQAAFARFLRRKYL